MICVDVLVRLGVGMRRSQGGCRGERCLRRRSRLEAWWGLRPRWERDPIPSQGMNDVIFPGVTG